MRKILARKGLSSSITKIEEGCWRITLTNDGLGRVGAGGDAETCSGPDFASSKADDGPIQIDLRGMLPPAPMVAVLRLAATLRDDQVVTVIHDRDPIYLYPELAEIGWELELVHAEGETLYFLLRKGS